MDNSKQINFTLNPPPDDVDWDAVTTLFDKVNWGKREEQEIREAFGQSSYYCIITRKDELIAMGRTVDDGKYYAMLVDVVVDPQYQGMGLGKEIVNRLKEKLEGYKFITLSAAPGKHAFYEKIGWKKQTSAFIYPRDEKQYEDHCVEVKNQ